MSTVDIEQLMKDLRNSARMVRFTKKDGSLRDLRCTLVANQLPERAQQALEQPMRQPNETLVTVWDLDKKAWRSFRKDAVVSVTEAELQDA